MSVLVNAEVSGMTAEMYDGLVAHLTGALQSSPGFLLHAGMATKNGWRVIEVWASRDEYDTWFDTHVKPSLPPGWSRWSR